MSPTEKNGFDVGFLTQGLVSVFEAAEHGDAAMFAAMGSFADPDGAALQSKYVARRTETGWETENLQSPQGAPTGPSFNFGTGVIGLNDDFTRSLLFTDGDPVLAPGATSGSSNVYVQDLTTGEYHFVATLGPEPQPALSNLTAFAASADFDHIAIEPLARTPGGDPDEDSDVVLRSSWTGSGYTAEQASVVGGIDIAGNLGSQGAQSEENYVFAMSEDGSRILFTDAATKDLYMRDYSGPGAPTTTWISEPDPGINEPSAPTYFLDSAQDHTKIFFATGQKLTADATGTGLGLGEIYRYDTETEELKVLTVDTGAPNGAEILGMMGVSEAGDRAYFVSETQLDTGEGQIGEPNIFLWEDGPGVGTITYIATLDSTFNPAGVPIELRDRQQYTMAENRRINAVSDNGRYLAFSSNLPLDPGEDGDDQVDLYLYDAEDTELSCLTCQQDNVGHSSLGWRLDGWTDMLRNYANGKLYFETPVSLVPADTNSRIDVYAYDLSDDGYELISTGQAEADSRLADVTETGEDVFFITDERLVATDRDNLYDLYTARVGGGIPAQNELPDPPCEGDECQAPPSAPPSGEPPASGDYAGAGNAEKAAPDCGRLERKAKRLAKQSKKLKRKARRANGQKRAKRLRQRARKTAKKAKRADKRADRCKEAGK